MAKSKQACFAHLLSKMFQIFTAVHNSIFLNSAAKILLSDLISNLSTYIKFSFEFLKSVNAQLRLLSYPRKKIHHTHQNDLYLFFP